MWESEFFKAFHRLRDGIELSGPEWVRPELARLTPQERNELNVWFQKAGVREFTALMSPVEKKSFQVLGRFLQEFSVRYWKESVLQELAALKPKLIPHRQERRALWFRLVKARTLPALKETCGRWDQLAKTGFPAYRYVLENAKQFFEMKRNPRFPRSSYADDSRIDYLARGMAGVLMNVSPQTAIERLRNMKHGPTGPLWKKEPGGLEYCGCWRCRIEQSQKYMEAIGLVDLQKGGKKK